MKSKKKFVNVFLIVALVIILIVSAIAIINQPSYETYMNMEVISEKDFEALPILDLGDGQATEENVTPADTEGIGDMNE